MSDIITPGPMVEEVTLNAIFRQLGRIETKVDLLHQEQADHVADNIRIHQDLETRVRAAEKFRWTALGGAGVLGTIGGLIVSYMKGWTA